MQRSAWAHFFARKLELPLWGRKREDWKAKMAQRTNEEKARLKAEEDAAKASAQPQAQQQDAQASTQKKKKRERKADEVDEIFASAATGKKAKAAGDGERKVKKAKTDKKERDVAGLEDVMSAIKASV